MDSHDSDGDDVPLAQRIKLDPDAFKYRNSSGAKVFYIHNPSLCMFFFSCRSIVFPQDNRNKYCWKCHRKIIENEKVKCSNCILTFHMNCMPDINRHKIDWRCPECQSADEPDDWYIILYFL